MQPVILGQVAFFLFEIEGFKILNAFFVPFSLEEMTSFDSLELAGKARNLGLKGQGWKVR